MIHEMKPEALERKACKRSSSEKNYHLLISSYSTQCDHHRHPTNYRAQEQRTKNITNSYHARQNTQAGQPTNLSLAASTEEDNLSIQQKQSYKAHKQHFSSLNHNFASDNISSLLFIPPPQIIHFHFNAEISIQSLPLVV